MEVPVVFAGYLSLLTRLIFPQRQNAHTLSPSLSLHAPLSSEMVLKKRHFCVHATELCHIRASTAGAIVVKVKSHADGESSEAVSYKQDRLLIYIHVS